MDPSASKGVSGVIRISGKSPGPRVGVMAVTHGDEPAGLAAHGHLLEYFKSRMPDAGELFLIQGNPVAAVQEKICIEENLNRLFVEDARLTREQKRTAEYRRSRELMGIIGSLDYLLDLHSTNNPGPVFAIIKNDDESRWDVAARLPVEFVSGGWNAFIVGTTCDWIEKSGGIGITIECGCHHDPRGGEVAVRAARSFLTAVRCHDFGDALGYCTKRFRVLSNEKVADAATFEYRRTYVNFESIAPGETIATDSARTYRAPDREGLAIVFPTKIESIRSGGIKEAYLLGTFL